MKTCCWQVVTVLSLITTTLHAAEEFHDVKWRASNRSYEYDSLGDRYARFLVEEIIPELKKIHPISDDPEGRAICGASSGGICSFTVAWERPDQFRKVLSTIGSYVNLRGGDAYPALIRKTERKPLRVYLEDSSGDLDNKFVSRTWGSPLRTVSRFLPTKALSLSAITEARMFSCFKSLPTDR